MPTIGDLSLYFHLPFCRKKCPYCDFYVVTDPSLKTSFLKGILQELFFYSSLLENSRLVSIYLGGGTPSVFPEGCEKILQALSPFIDPSVEITCEVNPEDLSEELVSRLKQAGVNRLSIGVQSFQRPLLNVIKRPFPSVEAIEKAHKTISNLSIDLLYDIPNQTPHLLEKDLKVIEKLPIDHISIYNLTIEENTPFFLEKPQKPSEKVSLGLLHKINSTLKSYGFNRYEISSFAKNGQFSRHTTGYWTGRNYLGLGPSAHSYIDGTRWGNIRSLTPYLSTVEKGVKPVSFTEKSALQTRQPELFALHLRLLAGVDLPAFEKRFSPLKKELKNGIETLLCMQLLAKTNQRIALTEKGALFYDTVLEKLTAHQ